MKPRPTPQAFSEACKQYDKAPWKPDWYIKVEVKEPTPRLRTTAPIVSECCCCCKNHGY